MDGLIMAAQLILGLTILVGVHELGHLLTAKFFKMKVDQFSIGFPPKVIGKQFGETYYQIGAIPMGGFVKIAGMVDESLDLNMLKEAPKPWEFRSKPAWHRLIVMMGGIIVNILTGIFIFIGLTYVFGDKFLPASEVKYGIIAHPLAQQIGLQTGDKIIEVNHQKLEKFTDIFQSEVLLGNQSSYTIERNNERMEIQIPANLIEKLSDPALQTQGFIDPIYPFSIAKVMPGSAAEKAGLQEGDKIISINHQPIQFFHELQQQLEKFKNQKTQLQIVRGGDTIATIAQVNSMGKLGFMAKDPFQYTTEKYSIGTSIQKGTVKAFAIIWIQMKAFKKMFDGDIDVSKSLSGPIGIAKEFGGTWQWYRFWHLTGMLSMVLAFMNFLPIPALDGGHVMFLTYEIITRRKPSDKFLEISQKIGMAILLSLTVYAIFNDVFKLIF